MNRIFSSTKGTQLTVFQEFAPITLFSQVLGIFPLKIDNVSGNQVFVTSRYSTTYSIVLLVPTFFHLIYLPQMTIAASNFVNGYGDNYTTSAKNQQNCLTTPRLLIRLLNGIIMSLMGISSKINATFYVRSAMPKIFASLSSIDRLLEPKLKQRQKNMKSIWIMVGITLLIGLPGQIHSSIFIHMGKSYFIGIYIFMNIFNNFTAVFAEAQFVAMCYLLQSRFELINRKLLDILKFHELQKCFFANPTGRTVSTHTAGIFSLSDIKCMANLRKELSIQKNTHSIYETIRTLRMGHQRLCDTLDQVNHMFQLQILFSISGCFLNELFNMHAFFFGGAWKVQENSHPITLNGSNAALLSHPLINLLWGIYYAIRIGAMATMASKTTKTAKHSVIHILDIRRSSIDFVTKEELLFFYDHVTSRKIQFSASGFFKLDIDLISSIVATGSTYLVMMVQLRE